MGRPLPLLVLLAAFLVGCGDAPSTTLAPDKPVPDASKLTPEQIAAMHNESNAATTRRK